MTIPSHLEDGLDLTESAPAAPGDYCTEAKSISGSHELTRAEVQVCLRVAAKNQLVLKVSNAQFFQDGSWSAASAENPFKWGFQSNLNGVGSYSGKGDAVVASGSVVIGEVKKTLNAGWHTVKFKYTQVGPHWGDEFGINYDGLNIIVLPLPPSTSNEVDL